MTDLAPIVLFEVFTLISLVSFVILVLKLDSMYYPPPKNQGLIIWGSASALVTVIAIPFRVIIARATVTSRQLRLTQPTVAYKEILYNAYERRNPLRLLLLPGLVTGHVPSSLLLSGIRALVTGYISLQQFLSPSSVALCLLLDIITALLITPFEVILTKLSLQEYRPCYPNYEAASESVETVTANPTTPALNGLDPPSYGATEGFEYTGMEEQVINFRTEQEPYRGLVDCARCIAREEGLETFWRGCGAVATVLFLLDLFYLSLRK
jgi:hypothetical protein